MALLIDELKSLIGYGASPARLLTKPALKAVLRRRYPQLDDEELGKAAHAELWAVVDRLDPEVRSSCRRYLFDAERLSAQARHEAAGRDLGLFGGYETVKRKAPDIAMRALAHQLLREMPSFPGRRAPPKHSTLADSRLFGVDSHFRVREQRIENVVLPHSEDLTRLTITSRVNTAAANTIGARALKNCDVETRLIEEGNRIEVSLILFSPTVGVPYSLEYLLTYTHEDPDNGVSYGVVTVTDQLTLSVRFDTEPTRCWSYETPAVLPPTEPEDADLLDGNAGVYTRIFHCPGYGAKYGIKWEAVN